MTGTGLGLIAVLSLFQAQATAGEVPRGQVHGLVVSSGSGAPVAYAMVEVVGQPVSDWTDEEGVYRLEGLERGRWRLRVVHPNHDSLLLEIFAPGNRDLSLDMTLRARPGPPVEPLADFEPFSVEYTLPALLNEEEVKALTRSRYPPGLAAAGIGGESVLWLWLDERGQVVRSLLSQSSGRPALDAIALMVAERMRFRPARNAGQALRVIVRIPVVFVAPLPTPAPESTALSSGGSGRPVIQRP